MTADPPEPDVTIDAVGQLCPQPVLALARAAKALGTGVVAVLADDPAAGTDIPAWCGMRGAQLLDVAALADGPRERPVTRYLVAVAAPR